MLRFLGKYQDRALRTILANYYTITGTVTFYSFIVEKLDLLLRIYAIKL